jgi:hypothetical protein
MPFGQFVQKYDIADAVQTIFGLTSAFGDARYTGRRKVSSCGVVGRSATAKYDADPHYCDELFHILP